MEPDAREVGVELVGRQVREQHVADRRAVRGKPPAHVERRRHDPRRRGSREVDDLVAVEHRERARLAQRLAEAVEDRLREHGDRRGRQVGVAERQHARAQVVAARVVGTDEAELRERVKAPPRGRAGDPREMRDLRDRHPAALVRERQHHGEAAGERGDEVAVLAQPVDGLRRQRVMVDRGRLLTGRDRPGAVRLRRCRGAGVGKGHRIARSTWPTGRSRRRACFAYRQGGATSTRYAGRCRRECPPVHFVGA